MLPSPPATNPNLVEDEGRPAPTCNILTITLLALEDEGGKKDESRPGGWNAEFGVGRGLGDGIRARPRGCCGAGGTEGVVVQVARRAEGLLLSPAQRLAEAYPVEVRIPGSRTWGLGEACPCCGAAGSSIAIWHRLSHLPPPCQHHYVQGMRLGNGGVASGATLPAPALGPTAAPALAPTPYPYSCPIPCNPYPYSMHPYPRTLPTPLPTALPIFVL